MATPMNLVEAFYSHRQLCVLLGKSNRSIVDKIRTGEFGDQVILDGWDYLVPASAVNEWIEHRRLFPEPAEPSTAPIAARSEGELRRKAKALRSFAPPGFSVISSQ
jgi:predicted DNA-binding transcriptional regulator AlpA